MQFLILLILLQLLIFTIVTQQHDNKQQQNQYISINLKKVKQNRNQFKKSIQQNENIVKINQDFAETSKKQQQNYLKHKNHNEKKNELQQKYEFENEIFHPLELQNYQNVQYFGQIEFGDKDNKENFTVQFDTGSDQLWICSVECQNCGSVKKYDCDQASTCYEYRLDQYNIQYGSGQAIGFEAQDQIWLGDDINISNQNFILITQTDQFKSGQLEGDGMCGLGLNSELLLNLYKSGQIQNKMFSLYLTNQSTNQKESQIIIGGVNYDLIQEGAEMQYFPLNSEVYWSIQMDQISLGIYDTQNQQQGIKQEQQITEKVEINFQSKMALIDSGSSLILLSEFLFESFMNILQRKFNLYCNFLYGQIVCQCQNNIGQNFSSENFPPLIFKFQDSEVEYILKAQDYLEYEDGFCYLGIGKTVGLPESMIILGDIFLNKFYVTFDSEGKQIGIAYQKQEVQNFSFLRILFICGCALVSLTILFIIWQQRQQIQHWFYTIFE